MISFLLWIARRTLALRYDISLHHSEVFDTDHPCIVFPNHPALVDPIILTSYIAKQKKLSPVMTETYFHTPGLGPIVRSLEAVPVGDIARGGSIEDVKKAFLGLKQAMEQRKNILVYPSGHIYVQPFEHIVGKKMAYEIVGMLPQNQRIILARTKGLWGSMWGKAYTGTSPELTSILLRSMWYILANGILFLPKRKVSIEFVDTTDELRAWHQEGIDIFNQKLQDFYNEGGNEVCQFIPHYFYHDDVAGKVEPQEIPDSIAALSKQGDFREEDIDTATLDTVKQKIAELKKIDPALLSFKTNLILDLHADSLDMAEIKASIQTLFPNASNPPIGLIKTIGDVAALALGKLQGEEKLSPVNFVVPSSEMIHIAYTPDDTILTLARRNFRSEKSSPFLYDAMTGMMTRDTFLLKSYVIGTYLRRYTEDHIGIMLPALSATSLLLFGTYLSGKLPVMLNWTVGEKSFAHCMNFAGLDTILTSRKFYEKITSPWLSQFESKMIFIEDIIRDIPLSVKLISVVRKLLFLLPKARSEAVMLFTSGSESLPKAVVLTHQNLLADIRGALELVPFHRHDTLLGFLPPFHSFGFTINTIFPLIAPLQVAYTPDPNDAKTIGKILAHTKSAIFSATPTFLRMILSANPKEILQSLRLVFVGAEKCTDDVFRLFQEKCSEATILEGYGITECSPIVTVNPLEKQKRGSAGKFLPQITPTFRSLEDGREVPVGEQGMIYVRGESIFSGYIDPAIESPFEAFDGYTWYKTGDLGYQDTDDFLYITGRLKRFVKIAGEMISLPAIESILLEQYGDPEVTTLAIEAKEQDGVVTIVAFTTFDMSPDELNNFIHANGASNLVKIARVERLEMIPVLGTGKTDYKLLKTMI